MGRRPTGSTRTDTPVPYTTLFRSRHVLFLGPLDRAGVEGLEAVAAHADRRLHALVGLGQQLGDAGDLLADLHAADAGGDHAGAVADLEHVRGKCLADP